MAQNVEYIVSLKDQFSGTLNKAKDGVKDFENNIDGLERKTSGLSLALKAVSAAAAGLAIGDFIRSSVTAYNEQAQAVAQLDAALRSTGGAAGLTRDALLDQADALQKSTLFGDEATVAAQSLLLTFTNIKDAVFLEAIPAIQDLATRMGGDLQGATVQVGKALNDPINGITALSRVGVSFTEQQKEVIKNLVETGNAAEAQRMILAELNREFGGSAVAAAEAGTGGFVMLRNAFGEVQEKVGQLAVDIGSVFLPALQAMVSFADRVAQTLLENKDIIAGVGIALGVMAGAYLIAQGPIIAVTIATNALTAATWLLNMALNANPIGIVVGALAILAGAIYVAWQRSEKFRGIVLGVWEVLKGFAGFVVSYFKSVGMILEGVFTLDPDKIKEGVKTGIQAYKDLATGIDDNFAKGQAKAMTAVAKTATDPAQKMTNAGTTAMSAATDTSLASDKGGASSAKSVTGNKSTTINVTIGNLVDKFTIQTTNVTDSPAKIRELIAATLIGVVNDSQIVAGQ